MSGPTVTAYGSWTSPIRAEHIASSTLGLSEIEAGGEFVYWVEHRPAEGGRYVVVRWGPGGIVDVIDPPYNARTRVHEYGGGAYLPVGDGVIFANFADQRLYRTAPGRTPEAFTPESEMRYADGVVDERRRRLICVREDHTHGGEPINAIVAIGLDTGGCGEVLAGGSDFYASPRLSPDGTMLAWLTWSHPAMPWDAAELHVATVSADGSLGSPRRVAGSSQESCVQPEWSPDGTLHFSSDRSDWWNLYRLVDGEVRAVAPMEAEFAGPQWRFRPSTYAFDDAGGIVCTWRRDGVSHLGRIAPGAGRVDEIETPFNDIRSLQVSDGRAWFVGGSAAGPAAVIRMDLASGGIEVIRRASELPIDPAYLSGPEAIEFPVGSGLTAHGLFYRPRNPDHVGPIGAKPPLLVMSHGGPTGSTSPALNLKVQYYTSRGFAVVDVNYGGSTGYGRAYRERLYGTWGQVDVNDCTCAALHLAEMGEVDPAKLLITGGSAGGYTTLAALVFRDAFAAGSSHFGVSDCEALARDTHKFESRYLDTLIGPYPARADLYRDRSPLHHADKLSCPVIFFQGLEDRIVPPAQAEQMVQALRAKGIPVAYVPFPGEQHGFRHAANIRRALEAELYFFSRVLHFDLAEEVEPVEIENL